MQDTLALITVLAAMLGLLFGFFGRRGAPATEPDHAPPGLALLWGALAVLAVFLLTLPSRAPFAAGLLVGWGALIGGGLGLAAVARSAYRRDADGVGRLIELLSLAALGPGTILLIFRGYPTPALLGCALGAAAAAFGAVAILRRTGDAPAARGAEFFALATALLAAGTRLGIDHFPRNLPGGFLENPWAAFSLSEVAGGYWAFPALAAAGAALLMALIPRERDGYWRALLLGGAGSLAVVVLTLVLGVKLLPALAWLPPLLGLAAFALLAVGLGRQEASGRPLGLAFGGALFTVVVLVIAFVFRGLHGYGEALVLLGGLPVIGALYLSEHRERGPLASGLAVGALGLGVLLVLYRVFLEQVAGAWRLDFQQHYDLVAVLLGAAATFGLLAFTTRTAERAAAGSWPTGILFGRASLLWVLTVFVPPALAALWGVNAVGAFLAGLIVGQAAWMLLAAWTVGEERLAALSASPAVPFTAAALSASLLSPMIFEMELTRNARLVIAVVLTLALMVWVAIDGAARSRAEEDGASRSDA